MTEKSKCNGSILKLVANKWKNVGAGKLILIHNKHNPTDVLIKIVRKGNNNWSMYQCKPKAKPNGKSLILKGTSTKTKKEFVLAIRFDKSNAMKHFQGELEKVQRWTLKISKKHVRRASKPPRDLRKSLSQFAWDCELCTYRNNPDVFDCSICNTPRPLKKREPVSVIALPSMHGNAPSIQIADLPPILTPTGNADTPTMDFPMSSNNTSFKPNGVGEIKENEEQLPAHNGMTFVNSEEYDTKLQENVSSDSVLSKEPSLRKSGGTEQKSVEQIEEEEKKSSIKELIDNVTAGIRSHGMDLKIIEDVILLLHATFVESRLMLNLLLNRCGEKNIDFATRARAVNLVQKWIKDYWDQDFHENDDMLDILDKFVNELDDLDVNGSAIKLISRIKSTYISQQNAAELKSKKKLLRTKTKKMIGDIDIPHNYNIMDEKSECVAEQLTLMDFEIFQKIAKREMIGQGWKKKDKERRSPHLLEMIKQFNKISKWVQVAVLSQKNKRQRSYAVKKFIKIAVHLKEMRNFSGCCAINFGLSATPIFRLKDCWNAVPKNEKTTYNDIQQTYKGKKNWEQLRILHKNATAPSILHTGLFLQDLLNTDEGNTDELRDGTTNFVKLKSTYTLIEFICMYQNSTYVYKKNIVMQEYLKNEWQKNEKITENKMYEISTLCKTKDAEGKDIETNEINWFS